MAPPARGPPRQAARRERLGLLPGGRRRFPHPGVKRGAKTGRSPVDRGRTGSKHHLITDATGIPLAATLTGGNRNDDSHVAAYGQIVGATQRMTALQRVYATRWAMPPTTLWPLADSHGRVLTMEHTSDKHLLLCPRPGAWPPARRPPLAARSARLTF
ncbi:hypothetical protein GCM10023097_29260 [Streptomyces collinus]